MAYRWIPLAGGLALGGVGAAIARLTSGGTAVEVGGGAASGVVGVAAGLAFGAADRRRAAAAVLQQALKRRDDSTEVLPIGRTGSDPKPSWLLLPDHEVTPFWGRKVELQSLLDWADAIGPTVMVLTGPAGVGKTRLLVQFARRVPAPAVVVRVREGNEAGLVEALLESSEAAIVIVDLKHPRPGLASLLQDAKRSRGRVKVVLECRGDAWRDSVRTALDESNVGLLDNAKAIRLRPVGGPEDLQRWVQGGTCAICALLEVDPSTSLTGGVAVGASMLDVQAAAVAAALDAPTDKTWSNGSSAHPSIHVDIGSYLLDHERRAWIGAADVDTDDTVQRRAVCLLTLLGAKDEADAASVLRRLPDLAKSGGQERRRSLARWVRKMYPGRTAGLWIGPLEPDLLAHALCAEVLDGSAIVERLVNPPLTSEQASRALQVLMPGLNNYPVLATAARAVIESSSLRAFPDTVLSALYLDDVHSADILLAAYIEGHASNLDMNTLRPAVVRQLRHTQVALLKARVQSARAGGDKPDLARTKENLAGALERTGRHQEALAAAEEAVTLYRELDQEDPALHRAGLAQAARRLAGCLEQVGRHPQALTAAEEAVALYRELDQEDPALHRAGLAQAARRLAGCLEQVGRHPQALTAAEEAVALYRELDREDPALHRAGLAQAVRDLAFHLDDMGHYPDGLAAAEEAIQLYRDLDWGYSKAERSEQGLAVGYLAASLDRMGRYPEALSASEAAVQFYRELARENPAVHQPGLAAALGALSHSLDCMGRYTEVLSPVQEALWILRELDRTNAGTQAASLALLTRTLAQSLARVGRHVEALAASEEAVRLSRELDRSNPAVHRPGLAEAMTSLVNSLDGVGRHQDAVLAAEEARTLYQELDRSSPASYRTGLSLAVGNLAVVLERVRRYSESLDNYQRAALLLQEAARSYPQIYSARYAGFRRGIDRLLPLVVEGAPADTRSASPHPEG